MTLREIILINSAHFKLARVKLDRDLFFLGDNGSGKTSFIRAIHFLYSGDIRTLGIPNDKEGFKEYYFPYEDSYIIYVFDAFFILMYKTSNDIVKIFSARHTHSTDRIPHRARKTAQTRDRRPDRYASTPARAAWCSQAASAKDQNAI